MLTLQQIFDAAWDWAIVQKKPQCLKGDFCAYRHDGNKCLIGAAIPDDLYKPEIETLCAETVFRRLKIDTDASDVALFELQGIHDNWNERLGDYTRYVERRLRNFAHDYELEVPGEAAVS